MHTPRLDDNVLHHCFLWRTVVILSSTKGFLRFFASLRMTVVVMLNAVNHVNIRLYRFNIW